MEVDVLPFVTMRGMKRSRSPDEAGGSERRTVRATDSNLQTDSLFIQKRPILSIDENVHLSSQAYSRNSSSASSRQNSEDWVKQAGGLTINSPLSPSDQMVILPYPPHRSLIAFRTWI